MANHGPDQAQDQLQVPFWITVFPRYKGQGFRVANQGPDHAQDQLHLPILDISRSWILAQDQLHVPILDISVSWIQGTRF